MAVTTDPQLWILAGMIVGGLFAVVLGSAALVGAQQDQHSRGFERP